MTPVDAAAFPPSGIVPTSDLAFVTPPNPQPEMAGVIARPDMPGIGGSSVVAGVPVTFDNYVLACEDEPTLVSAGDDLVFAVRLHESHRLLVQFRGLDGSLVMTPAHGIVPLDEDGHVPPWFEQLGLPPDVRPGIYLSADPGFPSTLSIGPGTTAWIEAGLIEVAGSLLTGHFTFTAPDEPGETMVTGGLSLFMCPVQRENAALEGNFPGVDLRNPAEHGWLGQIQQNGHGDGDIVADRESWAGSWSQSGDGEATLRLWMGAMPRVVVTASYNCAGSAAGTLDEPCEIVGISSSAPGADVEVRLASKWLDEVDGFGRPVYRLTWTAKPIPVSDHVLWRVEVADRSDSIPHGPGAAGGRMVTRDPGPTFVCEEPNQSTDDRFGIL